LHHFVDLIEIYNICKKVLESDENWWHGIDSRLGLFFWKKGQRGGWHSLRRWGHFGLDPMYLVEFLIL
jgi:hypothetical protein